jgi:hypothetical protein
MTPQLRLAVYTVLASLFALLTAYGFVTQEQASLWLDLSMNVAAVLALVLAAKHVPKVE